MSKSAQRESVPTEPARLACLLQCRSFRGGLMAISMYQASVPVFVCMLTNLKNILGKASAFAQSKKIEDSVLLNARLFPYIFSLTSQVHIATVFVALRGLARAASW